MPALILRLGLMIKLPESYLMTTLKDCRQNMNYEIGFIAEDQRLISLL